MRSVLPTGLLLCALLPLLARAEPARPPMTARGPMAAPSSPLLSTPAEGLVTRERRPTVTGQATPSATVVLSVDGMDLGRTTAGADGAFSLASPVELAEGLRHLQISTESLGLRSLPDTRAITVDSTGPEAPTVTHPLAGEVVTEPRPLFSGTAEPAATVSAWLGDTVLPSTVADAEGRWQLPAPDALEPREHLLVVAATDLVGNEGASASIPFRMAPHYDFDVGYGCGSSPGAWPGVLALLGLAALRARRRPAARDNPPG